MFYAFIQVTSASAKPRFAGRQPSIRGGVPRVTTRPVRSGYGKRGFHHAGVLYPSEVSVTTATVSPQSAIANAAAPDPRQVIAGRPLAAVTGAEIQAPLISGGHVRYANLDYGASAPALSVVSAYLNEILPYYASVHRGAGYASQISTSVYENARSIVREFVGGRPDDSVIFTRNTTDSLNLLAGCLPLADGRPAGDVLYLDIEHHANLLPWQGVPHRSIVAADTISGTLEAVRAELEQGGVSLLAVTGASNVTGEILPIRALAALAHQHGARIVVDAAQLAPHRRVDISTDDVDYLAFSGHKLYAPFGAGVLVGRPDWLDAGVPHLAGGGAVKEARLDGVSWATGPARHEGGSPNVLGAATLARATQVIAELDQSRWHAHESAIRSFLVEGLQGIDGVTVHQNLQGHQSGNGHHRCGQFLGCRLRRRAGGRLPFGGARRGPA
ncbi:selenocysteine lyase/cysteine desulfurase [Arthrobacter sp. SLBN-112]|nr:selenocysteine lyase/cysteine desulfurase [Arthrobacter sp. SLBN-112]